MQEENISFEMALQQQGVVFARDWEAIVKYKTRYLRLKFLHIFKKEFLRYFSWPKIAITIFLTALMFWLEAHPPYRISKFTDIYIIALSGMGIYFRRKDKLTRSFWRDLKAMNKSRGTERQVMIDAIRKKPTWLNLLSARQLTRVGIYFSCFEALFFLAVCLAAIYHLDLLSRLVVYFFPFVVIVTLAWRKVRIEIGNTIHKDYAHVPGE